jgi:hypothetical protein
VREIFNTSVWLQAGQYLAIAAQIPAKQKSGCRPLFRFRKKQIASAHRARGLGPPAPAPRYRRYPYLCLCLGPLVWSAEQRGRTGDYLARAIGHWPFPWPLPPTSPPQGPGGTQGNASRQLAGAVVLARGFWGVELHQRHHSRGQRALRAPALLQFGRVPRPKKNSHPP